MRATESHAETLGDWARASAVTTTKKTMPIANCAELFIDASTIELSESARRCRPSSLQPGSAGQGPSQQHAHGPGAQDEERLGGLLEAQDEQEGERADPDGHRVHQRAA